MFDKAKMLAQAYTMRAFMYFVMTRTWGDLIIHTDPIENTNSEVLYKERRPQTEVFQLIKDDLEKALSLYPDDNFGDQRAMWSKPATLACSWLKTLMTFWPETISSTYPSKSPSDACWAAKKRLERAPE